MCLNQLNIPYYWKGEGLNEKCYLDNGDGSGRHATKVKAKKEGKN